MRTSVGLQIWRLSVLFLAGTSVNILFRVYTAFRGAFGLRGPSRHFLDMFFAAAALSASAYAVFRVNWGELRLYVAMSLGTGFFLSDYLVGDLAYLVAYRGFCLAKRGGNWVSGRVLRPAGRSLRKSVSWAKSWLFPPLQPPPPPPDEPAP